MTIKKISIHDLLNRVETLEEKNIKLLKKIGVIRFVFGSVCFVIAVIPNGLGIIFYPLSFLLLGLSFFEIKNIYWPELKRKITNKLRGRVS